MIVNDESIEEESNDEESEDEESELEAEFQNAVDSANDEITVELNKAGQHLNAACKIAEKYGIPFRAPISFLDNVYVPESFTGKFGDLDRDTVTKITEIYDEFDFEQGGWVHSAVCY